MRIVDDREGEEIGFEYKTFATTFIFTRACGRMR